ncbi:MAG: phosphoribosyltransferase [Candidatus Heimdallarchaeota archaeon]|nr:phosphoribosyltransferase [Candidatus Heimdallarchaeota archaeon]MDH5646744.1 phosphoribosyltransferase [Candidatus Heimdallarchaeota archaeon]
MEYLVQNWQDTFDKTFFLFEQIHQSGFIPDIIVGIARGGWVPSRLLADFFFIKMTANIKIEAYEQIGKMDSTVKIIQDINIDVKAKKVLIVDDIADSGLSLELAINSLEEKGCNEIKTVTLYYKEQSKIIPDYYATKTNAWVIFPWEYFESIKELNQLFSQEGLGKEEIIMKLKTIGIPSTIVNSYFM